MRRDYYAVLGVVSTAGLREIRQAYRRLARQYSPDVNFWDVHARALFDEIAEAYRVLSDPQARELYDRLGVPGGGSLGAGRRGENVHAAVELDFSDVVTGVTIDLPVVRFSPCPACRATGLAGDARCAACGGRGVGRVTEVVGVTIPAGVDAGVEIRVPGEGSAGPFGGPRGDLIVATRVREHPFFSRKGDNVHCEVPVSVWEALRGARIRIPTPSGETAIVVPPGTSSGQVFRVRGQGVPKLSSDGAGDLYVTVRVEMPGSVDPRTHELIRELERLLPMEPRAHLAEFRGGAA